MNKKIILASIIALIIGYNTSNILNNTSETDAAITFIMGYQQAISDGYEAVNNFANSETYDRIKILAPNDTLKIAGERVKKNYKDFIKHYVKNKQYVNRKKSSTRGETELFTECDEY